MTAEGLGPVDWAALWGTAAGEVAGSPPFAEVYTGPVWAGPLVSATTSVALWKLSVLERRVSGGASHWGHLFLVVARGPGSFTLETKAPVGPGRDPLPVQVLVRPPDYPFELRMRPSSEETAARLREFGLRVAEHLARLTRV